MRSLMVRILVVFFITIFSSIGLANAESRFVQVIPIEGAIGPASTDFILSEIQKANASSNCAAIILKINTPGGLGESMRSIIQAVLASKIPVMSYVSPSGSRAASAGTYILYATAVAAMSPGTNVGAASPVSMSPSAQTNTISALKAKKDAIAYIKSLAELHGRDASWAMKSVEDGDSLSAAQALKKGVINYVAVDIPSLLAQVNGANVIVNNKPVMLNTLGLATKVSVPSWQSRFLMVITDPSIAYLLFVGSLFCLAIELLHPGLLLPGVLGVLGLCVSLYAFQMLPISFVGLALIVLGVVFVIAEFFIASFGVLGVAGVVSLLIGSMMLFPSSTSGYGIDPVLMYSVPIILGGILLFLIGVIVRDRRKPPISNMDSLIGKEGVVTVLQDNLWVKCRGDVLQIDNPGALHEGDRVVIERLDGARVIVKRAT